MKPMKSFRLLPGQILAIHNRSRGWYIVKIKEVVSPSLVIAINLNSDNLGRGKEFEIQPTRWLAQELDYHNLTIPNEIQTRLPLK